MPKPPSHKNPRKPASAQRKPARKKVNWWLPLASILVLGAGLYRAIQLRWICDDAFITMRYVKNFVEGKGLVYNVGERVEGYTHFLWLMLLAAAKAIGFDPVDASIWLGIAAYAGVLVLLLAISRREHKKNSKALWLPIAAALFALNYDAAVWASGGLETSFYALLILAAFYLWFYSKFSEQRRLLLSGVALALVALTRPDGVLFTATAVLLLAVRGIKWKQSLSSISKSIGILLLPSVIVGVPYLLWKYFYYGDILPLTYYAKSAGEDYFSQGFFYIWLYFRVYFVSAIAFIAAIVLLFRKRNNDGQSTEDLHRGSPYITALSATVVYLVIFVARVGGDFMFARFIIPVVPFIYFVIERGVNRVPSKVMWPRVGIAFLLLASFVIEEKIRDSVLFHTNDEGQLEENWDLKGESSTHGIADERWTYYSGGFYSVNGNYESAMQVYSEIGEYLKPFFQGLHFTVAIPGAANMKAYYADFETCINIYGLTDSSIAHSPISNRERIGHEKIATEAYLMKRNVNFELKGVVAELPEPLPIGMIAFQIPTLGLWQLAQTVVYDKEKIEELSNRSQMAGNESILSRYENILPFYINHVMGHYSLHQLEEDYSSFRRLYFNRYPDSSLERPFEARIAELKQDSAAENVPKGRNVNSR